MNYKAVTFVSKPDQLPQGEHWAIIKGISVFIPGDERSKTNPGHGYPESTEHHITYQAYKTEKDFKEAFMDEMKNQSTSIWSKSTIKGIHILDTYDAEPKWDISVTKSS